MPLLIGFDERSAVSSGPLGVFNAILFTKEDIWKLILTLNGELNVSVHAQDLAETFELFWPQLDEQVKALRAASPAPVPVFSISSGLCNPISGVRSSAILGNQNL